MAPTEGHYDALIVGAGHGGTSAALGLRRIGFQGTIGILSQESDYPYERPPLSKDYLAGERSFERLLIRPEGFWPEHGIDLRLGRTAVAVDTAAHSLDLDDGTALSYGSLVWAAGGKARRLACCGHDVGRVHTVRTRADVDALRAEAAASRDVVVVGGGYIGLEAAAVLTGLGKKVTVLEAADRLLARVSSLPLSRFFEAEHRRHGVEVRLDAQVESIQEEDGIASGVRLADGTVAPADIVIVGIGIDPCVAPLLAAGATSGPTGIRVDAYCRSDLPDLFVIGDCAAYANPFAGGATVRLESVQNAAEQGLVAAKAIAGMPEPYRAIPWFWSDQYDLRLQTIGIALGHDEIVTRGDGARAGFSILYLKQKRVIALDCVNSVKDYVQGRQLILSGALVSPERLADTSLPLKSLVPTR
jgi:3-phenylpropionate/trans-cinnamate dioxygenase ferredoxin reductase subunit